MNFWTLFLSIAATFIVLVWLSDPAEFVKLVARHLALLLGVVLIALAAWHFYIVPTVEAQIAQTKADISRAPSAVVNTLLDQAKKRVSGK